MKKKLCLTGAIVLAGLLAGCATAPRGEPAAGARKTESPEIQRGREVFLKNCQQCHPGGEAGVGPALNGKPLPGFLIKTQVRWGFGGMPSFNKTEIGPADLSAVVAFLQAVRHKEVPPPAETE